MTAFVCVQTTCDGAAVVGVESDFIVKIYMENCTSYAITLTRTECTVQFCGVS